MARTFTVEQANEALISLRPLVQKLLELRKAILARQPEIWPALEKAVGNGGSQVASQAAMEFIQLDTLARQIQSSGAVLKDLNIGLLDFPSLRDGKQVYLCWQYGEESVQYWHDLDSGYAGRQKI